ncbi:MAG: type II toxin-antitoxin system RelE/ParE family toxin [Gaiellaceae bacterium MAG52_C11]|nr:type II toxin-antitoxin system RelE/ParE family toxin [Candidatus Gaiellasilicea maunaloa]
MARVELSARAVENLTRLIETSDLPADTRERVKASLRPLARFPLAGVHLEGRWDGFRFVLGPRRWMILVHAYLEDEQRVVVVTIRDGRTAEATTERP